MKAGWYIAGISLLYVLLCLAGISHHELWQDEAHHLLLGRDSHNLSELLTNTAYEGHPPLWNLILFVLMHSLRSLWLVQLVHAGIATACVVLILRDAPFSWPVRLLIVFGYFLAYEYSVLTRSYSLALLLLILALIHLSATRRSWLYITVLLVLLCQVHVFVLFLALGCCIYLYPDWSRLPAALKTSSALILLSGAALALAHSFPPGDHFLHSYNQEPFWSLVRLGKLWQVPLKGVLPMPDLSQAHYWNSHVLISHLPWLGAFLSLLIFILPAFLIRSTKLKIMYYLPVSGILLFFYLTPLMLTNRNCGYLSICLLAVLWLQSAAEGQVAAEREKKPLHAALVYTILICQLYAGVVCYVLDLSRPFSNARNTAAFLQSAVSRNDTQVLLSNHGAGPALAICSDRPLYYLEPDTFGTFCLWYTRPFLQTDEVLLHKIGRRLEGSPHTLLLLNEAHRIASLGRTNDSLQIIPGFKPELLKAFSGAVVGSEDYFVYRLK